MTGFQKTIATIGGMAALVALFLSIGQADDAGWPIVVGSLAWPASGCAIIWGLCHRHGWICWPVWAV